MEKYGKLSLNYHQIPTLSVSHVYFSSDLETDVEWEVSDPFIIEPVMTKFNARQTKTFRAIFKPRVRLLGLFIIIHWKTLNNHKLQPIRQCGTTPTGSKMFVSWSLVNYVDDLSHDMTKPTMWLCTQRKFRSAWASAQSDQSLHCALSG